jgi:hypothetical protein
LCRITKEVLSLLLTAGYSREPPQVEELSWVSFDRSREEAKIRQ